MKVKKSRFFHYETLFEKVREITSCGPVLVGAIFSVSSAAALWINSCPSRSGILPAGRPSSSPEYLGPPPRDVEASGFHPIADEVAIPLYQSQFDSGVGFIILESTVDPTWGIVQVRPILSMREISAGCPEPVSRRFVRLDDRTIGTSFDCDDYWTLLLPSEKKVQFHVRVSIAQIETWNPSWREIAGKPHGFRIELTAVVR